MFGYVFFGLFIVVILYAYVDHEGQFTATSSAIKQIWSGSCRLSCRNNKSVQSDPGGHLGTSDNGVAMSSYADASNSCICASCPCQLVENVLQRILQKVLTNIGDCLAPPTCSPITKFYSTIVEALFLAYYDFIKACTDLYERTQTSMQSKEAVEGIPQNGGKLHATNFMFDESAKIVIKKPGDKGPMDSEPGTSNVNDNREEETKTKASVEVSVDIADTSCPSCVEKGLTCIGRCPADRS